MAQTDYEQLADRYDEDRERFAVPRDPVIEQLLAGGPARVLDLGCGTGRWLTAQAAAFVDAGLDLIGVDPSVGMLHAARSKRVPCLVCARAEELDPAVVLADAERRVISQLAMLDDEPYARGLADLRAFAASASSPLDSITPLLRLVARRR